MLAATLAIVGGTFQAFKWGAACSEMVITATRLERERNRIRMRPAERLAPIRERAVLEDPQGFFQRLFGSGGRAKSESAPQPQPEPANGGAE
jgi:hypothetical protein